MAKNFLDWSVFTDPNSGLDFLRHAIPNTNVFDGIASQDVKGRFTAVVLSNRVPLSAAASKGLKSAGNSADSNSNLVAKYIFKARIDPKMNPTSPHVFLQDPCDLANAQDPYRALSAISLHTTFVVTTTPGMGVEDLPTIGDIVEVGLYAGDQGGFNLQYGVYMKKVAPGSGGKNATDAQSLQSSCEQMKEVFDNMPPWDSPQGAGSEDRLIVKYANDILAHPTYQTWKNQVISGRGLPGAAATAQAEIDFWAGRKESSNHQPAWANERLKVYWGALGMTGEPDKEKLPWSAAFISYVQGKSDSTFPGSSGHVGYASSGLLRRKSGETKGWLTFHVSEQVKVSIGDVFVKPRYGKGSTYYSSHGDVVYKISGDTAYLAGGNVGDTAKEVASKINLKSDGTISSAGQYVVVLKKV